MATQSSVKKQIKDRLSKFVNSGLSQDEAKKKVEQELTQSGKAKAVKDLFSISDSLARNNNENTNITQNKINPPTDIKGSIVNAYKLGVGSGRTRDETLNAIRNRLKESGQFEAVKSQFQKTRDLQQIEQERLGRDLTTAEKLELQQTGTPIGISGQTQDVMPPKAPTTDITTLVEEPKPIINEVTEEQKTLRDLVREQITGTLTQEEAVKKAQEDLGLSEAEATRKLFSEEASNIKQDLDNIAKGLEAEGGAITSIAASRIREARSAPLRDQLASIAEGIAGATTNIEEINKSVDSLLEARRIDRENEVKTITAQIEASTLSNEQKNQLLTQLGVQTERMKKEDEFEAFAQKELFKKQLEQANEESLSKTGLTSQQVLEANSIITDLEIKEDSLAGQAVRGLLKEGKTPDEIRKIIGLAETDEFGIIDDTQFARQENLRKEFESSETVKNYLDATQQFAGILNTLGTATGPGDIAGIFQFMKTLDPSSVVRETEFSTAAESSGILDRLQSLQLLKKAESGQILTPKQREQFVQIAKVLFENRKNAFDQKARQYIRLSKEAGVNPKSVVLDWENVPGSATSLTEEDLLPLNRYSSEEEWINYYNNQKNQITNNLDDDSLINYLNSGEFNTGNVNEITETNTGNVNEITETNTSSISDIPTTGFIEQIDLPRTGTNIARDTNNPGNITADSIPSGYTKQEYGELIGATGTYKSTNGREYFIFPTVEAGTNALKWDVSAKIQGRSGVINPDDTLATFQRVYVGYTNSRYLAVLKKITGASDNTPIKNIDPDVLTEAVMQAEGFTT